MGKNLKTYVWLIWLSAGVLAAVLLAVLRTEMMADASIRQIQSMEILMNWKVSGGFLIYLLLCRGLPFYLMIFLTLRTGRLFFMHFYLMYCGFSYGIQAVLTAMQYRLSGIPLCAAQALPQLFCYAAALYLGYKLGTLHGALGRAGMGRRTAAAFVLWTLGILIEWAVNPGILRLAITLFL